MLEVKSVYCEAYEQTIKKGSKVIVGLGSEGRVGKVLKIMVDHKYAGEYKVKVQFPNRKVPVYVAIELVQLAN